MSGYDFLRGFATSRWPDAVVYEDRASGDFHVRITVPRKQLVADKLAAMVGAVEKLTARTVTRRRLHWARRTRRRA